MGLLTDPSDSFLDRSGDFVHMAFPVALEVGSEFFVGLGSRGEMYDYFPTSTFGCPLIDLLYGAR